MTQVVPIDDMLSEVLRYAPNVADPEALRCLREAAREFCRRTMLWREHDTLTLTTPADEVLITQSDAAIVRIESARFNDHKLEPVTVAFLDTNEPDWQSAENDASTPRYVTQMLPNSVAVVPKATGTLKVTLILQPSRRAETVPAFLMTEYGDDIGKGAAARVMLMPNATVGNPQYGARLESEWKARLDALAPRGARGQQGARIRSTARFF